MQVRRACRLGIPPFHPLYNVNGEEIKAHTETLEKGKGKKASHLRDKERDV
jgi:hypothetical protein